MNAARSAAAAYPTSPTSLPFGMRLMPTSNTAAPGRIHSPGTNSGLPTRNHHHFRALDFRAQIRVPVWHTVTVERASSSSSAMGRPTMFEAPTTTARLPVEIDAVVLSRDE